MNLFFENRTDAGQKLLAELKKQKIESDIVLALPKGGVVVAAEVAKGLSCPLDILLVRKLGAPFNSELAVGAVVEGNPPHTYLNHDMINILKVDEKYLAEEKALQLKEIARQRNSYQPKSSPRNISNLRVLLIDDGVATGASIRAAIEALHLQKPKSVTLAVPVIPPDIAVELTSIASRIVCLEQPADFRAVGQFYRDFRLVTDENVKQILSW